ncbi:hypothetical protein ACFL43_00355 [Thermodesulfobacteriota bacterium]
MPDENKIQLILQLIKEYKATFGHDPFPGEPQPWIDRDEDEIIKALDYALKRDLPLHKK